VSGAVDIYVRVSRVGGRENLISPDEQERRARALAQERGLDVGKVIEDIDESGGKWDRPGLQEALSRVRSRESAGLIVAWLDRLSRDSEHAHRLVREITEAGGALYAPDAPADFTNPEGRLHAGLVFTFAQYVRERARESFARAGERSIAAGVPVSSRVAAGYERGPDRRLRPSEHAPKIRKAFEMRAAGSSITEVSDALEGVPTSFGATTWQRQAVATLLRSRTYLGEARWRGFVNQDAHEPLVDLPTWMAAQSPGRNRGAVRSDAGDFLLTGILRCAACGYSMTGSRPRGGRYQCKGRHPGGHCPAPAYCPMREIEEAIERLFLESPLAELELEGEQPAQDVAPLVEALETAERRLAQALAPEMQDAAGEAWTELVRERRQERDAAAAQLGTAQGARARQSLGVTDARTQWASLSTAERRAVLAEVFDAVAVRKIGKGQYDVAVFRAGRGPVVPTRARGSRATAPALRPIEFPPDAALALL
jgi:site-specific DNA recombinase